MGTYNALGPLIKATVDNLRGQEKQDLEATLQQKEIPPQALDQAREALQFYADPQTYGISGGSVDRILQDRGQRAQQALKAMKEHP